MKVGIHAQESLEDIILRKTQEIADAGFALWGYGGSTCHPVTMVQPFAQAYEERGEKVFLCMQEIVSKHWAEPVRAEQMSSDGNNWTDIPKAVNARGSRYALIIKNLRKEEFVLPLARTRVAVGNSTGRDGSSYVSGRVDKACLEMTENALAPLTPGEPQVNIGLVADIDAPYAVYLR
jgi:hypothetical protein